MKKLTDLINKSLADYDIEYRIHATRRMFQRDIHEDEVESILRNGNIIEQYKDDLPLPSVLINGLTTTNRPLHIVIAINEEENKILITTTYEPDLNKWIDKFSRRAK